MKMLGVLLSLVAFLVVGCGPSAEQKKMLADLTGEVTTMVNDATSSLTKMDDASGMIASAIAGADTLAMKYPKDTTAINAAVAQLNVAKDRVMSVKNNVNEWLENYKTPDVATMKFDEVISNLKTSKDELTSAGSEIEGALGAATTALDGYKSLSSELMTKVAARMPKK